VIIDLASWVLLTLGAIFSVIGGIGLVRLPDLYSRCHAVSVSDTAGAGLILFGLMLQAGLSLVTVKLIMVLLFLWLTSPASTHALAKAAYSGGLRAD
jgi:multicomponent Na+:H+ antiporter subunit G